MEKGGDKRIYGECFYTLKTMALGKSVSFYSSMLFKLKSVKISTCTSSYDFVLILMFSLRISPGISPNHRFLTQGGGSDVFIGYRSIFHHLIIHYIFVWQSCVMTPLFRGFYRSHNPQNMYIQELLKTIP